MILPNSDLTQAAPGTKASEVDAHSTSSEAPPPDYTSSASLSTSAAPPLPKYTNYLHLVQEDNAIKGIYYIDPALRIPAALLSVLDPSEKEQDRKNVYAKTTHRNIDLELNIVRDNMSQVDAKLDPQKRITLKFESSYGTLTAKINDTRTPDHKPPLYIELCGQYSPITLYLPRSFTGPIRAKSKHGAVVFSEAVQQELVTISDNTYFLGDLSTYSDDVPFTGDEASLTGIHGRIWIGYIDEYRSLQRAKANSAGKSPFRRMFGF